MKDNEKLLTVLNNILVDELNTINQKIFHSEASENLGYGKLYEEIEKETTEELKQAEWLIKRIIFLEAWKSRQSLLSMKQNNINDSYASLRNVG